MSLVQSVATALTGARITDEVIASDLLAAGKLGAISLTLAALESATPELRRFYQDTLNECLAEHAAVYRLALDRGWYKAFDSPDEQLELDLKLSEPAARAAEQ